MVFCCSVCQERLEVVTGDSDPRVCAVKCGHIFHYECIRQWWLTLFRSIGITHPPSTFQPRVRCPVCRQENVAQLFEIHLRTADDNLFPTENEIQEWIILRQNTIEVEGEYKQIKMKMENKDFGLSAQEETMAKVDADVDEIIKERDNLLALGKHQDKKKSREPQKRRLVTSENNSCKLKKKSKGKKLLEYKQMQTGQVKLGFRSCKTKTAENNRYNFRYRGNCTMI